MRRASLALALVAAGCGVEDEQPVARGHLARAENAVLFLTWQRDGENVRGTIVITQPKGDEDGVLHAAEATNEVAGTVDGERVVLQVVNDSGATARWTGTLRDNLLVLQPPREETSNGTLRFMPATSEGHARALEGLKDSINEYPRPSVRSFVSTCAKQSGASHAACKCVIERLQLTMSFSQFEHADRAARESRPLEPIERAKLVEAANLCR